MTSVSRMENVFNGIVSYCTSNMEVICNLLEIYKGLKKPILIEATANQVNQDGGYTGMTPIDFSNRVRALAEAKDFPLENLILGGDHLGPLTWKNYPEEVAMFKAKKLIHAFVEAGFQKIHLDTSMKLATDDTFGQLSLEKIANRGCDLFLIAEEVSKGKENNCFYTIGSEVPIPGGEVVSQISVTKKEDVKKTVEAYRQVFFQRGVSEEQWQKIKAIVVQPGVEFSTDTKISFDKSQATDLADLMQHDLSGFVYEGHSTDYQSRDNLKAMVASGIKILKVGPALTFAYRAVLDKLEIIEKELMGIELSNFNNNLNKVMNATTKYWSNYYHKDMSFNHGSSYLDRERYYLVDDNVIESIKKLKSNVDKYSTESQRYKWFPREFSDYESCAFKGGFSDFVILKAIEFEVSKYEYAICE